MSTLSFSRRFGVGLAAAILQFGVAHAGGISTPILLTAGGNQVVCIANNVSAAPITVTVQLFALSNSSGTCTLPAGDNFGCRVSSTSDTPQTAHCVITVRNIEQSEVNARVRGVMFVRNTATSIPNVAVQAE